VKNRKTAYLSIALIICAAIGVAAYTRGAAVPARHEAAQQHGHDQKPQEQPRGQQQGALEVVEAQYVCMINDQRFAKKQFEVEAGGRTYYGCCEMCKDKLENDASTREATDPVSGKKVDKATAVIGADADGKVYYFESAENLKKFKAPKS
jgi:YHS domain-containing protein